MKAIQKELGEGDERTQEIDALRAKIEAAGMSDEAKAEALRELDRLAKMPPAAAEYTVVRTYIDWLVAMPWQQETTDAVDIAPARVILDEDHEGLEKVKDRILEYLAVKKIRAGGKDPILCFVGPPGVGKTSLGRSIARALGRKFHRISLGGMRDEAEIRGHRRTYIGALPGQIVQGLRRAGTKNPVFMLDEIDKLGMDFRGDPASALLEVLDPEQNGTFRDHYLDVAFDLSRVLFITTANVTDTVPAALRDRMEVIPLAGYTEEEKIAIAQRHLVPKQAREHGLEPVMDVEFTPEALRLPPTFWERGDTPVHGPAGAIPKDGPSAGVTMTTALVSLLTGRRVRPGLAMTGEVSLSGRVLPVGGIKEKILAAHRAGIRTVLLPRRNEKNLLEDVPARVRDEMTFHLVDLAPDVVRLALEDVPAWADTERLTLSP